MAITQETNYEQYWAESLNRGDTSVADEVFAADCIVHLTGVAEPIRGVEAWKQAVSGFLVAFPDLRFTIEEQVLAGNTVATRWHARGTHTGPFGPLPATGRAISIDGLIFDHLIAGKVAERWEQFDQSLLLQQLGIA